MLGEFSLADAADGATSGYSGGMRRRLDLAATPEVLFLDDVATRSVVAPTGLGVETLVIVAKGSTRPRSRSTT